MTDFYSVLRKSIETRGLGSAGERRAVYDQARRAMIKRLWSHDPPLGEDEISNRIAFFDAAVERIEGDFSAAGPAPVRAAVETVVVAESRTRGTIIYEGYDEVADYAPAVAWPLPDEDALAAEDPVEDGEASGWGGYDSPDVAAEDERPQFLSRQRAAPMIEDRPRRTSGRRWDGPAEDAAGGEEEASPGRFPRREPWRKTNGDGEDPRQPRRAAETPRREAKAKKPQGAARHFDRRVALLSAVIVVLAIVLAGLVVFLISPHSSAPTTAGNGPGSSKDGSRVIADPAAAVEVANQIVTVRQSFDVFDGRDPTVFESSPSNPVQFDHDVGGAFARIASEVESSGSRALIGVGLAQQFAGQKVRITLVARSSRESGATKLRFAYQSGVAISQWQVANLTSSYSPMALIWRVPTQRTSAAGDFVLIEPGVPGDGTRADIKSIKIELLAS